MAEFGRKALRAIFEDAGIEIPPKDVLGKICDLNSESADGKDETIKDLKEQLAKVTRERDSLQASDGENWKEKYKKEHETLEKYKADQTAKETKTAKEKAARAYLEGKSITGDNLDIAMMAVSGLIDGLDLDGENIKDTKSLDDLVSGKLARLVVTQKEKGANPATPPQNHSSAPKTRAEVYEKDDKGRFKLDASQRQEALAKIIANEQKG